MPDVGHYALLAVAAFLAGAMNSVAGGGTLLTFPALMGIGVPATVANATSTVALLPGSLAGAWGYRKELRSVRRFALLLLPVSLVGGTLGALFLVWFPDEFKALVPWLILTAAVLFFVQPFISRFLKKQDSNAPVGGSVTVGVMLFQFLVAVYGGYFGAGIGILMITALGFMGIGDIHRVNAVKTFLAAMINGASVIVFVKDDLVRWDFAGAMAGSAIVGGYMGARIARRLPAIYVRYAVIVIGFGLSAFYFLRQYG